MTRVADRGNGDIPVLVVDDSLAYRILVKQAVDKIDGFKVIDVAENGQVALEKTKAVSPQVVLLDVEMPVLDGLQTLAILRREHPRIAVIMVSSLTTRGSNTAVDALAKGALECVAKPDTSKPETSHIALLESLREVLAPLRESLQSGRVLPRRKPSAMETPAGGKGAAQTDVNAARSQVRSRRPEIIAIGISTGGPKALTQLIPQLPRRLPPVAIVQHIPGDFVEALADKLDSTSGLVVKKARHGEVLEQGGVYFAPGQQQMRLVRRGGLMVAQLTDDPPENHCKPAADYLFRSVAEHYGRAALGIVMTGMGEDGARGLLKIRQSGGLCIAQDEASSTVYGMPRQALQMNAADFVLSLDSIAHALMGLET